MGRLACMQELEKSYKILAQEPQWKRPLRGPRCGCENNIKMDHMEMRVTAEAWV
jgi:hypothetical protein